MSVYMTDQAYNNAIFNIVFSGRGYKAIIDLTQNMEAMSAGTNKALDRLRRSIDPKELPIEDAGLSTRAVNLLKRGGYKYLSELGEVNPDKLMRIKGLGRTTLGEIIAKAEKQGVLIKGVNE